MFAAGGDATEAVASTRRPPSPKSPELEGGRPKARSRAKVIEVQTRLAPLKNVLMDALVDVKRPRAAYMISRARDGARLCMVPERDLDLLIGDFDQDPRETKRRARKALCCASRALLAALMHHISSEARAHTKKLFNQRLTRKLAMKRWNCEG